MNSLIVFLKNPEKGKVKTRLAATVGEQAALEIYKYLLDYTLNIIQPVEGEKYIFYSDHIGHSDIFDGQVYQKRLQSGKDLGERMLNAFKEVNKDIFSKTVIIGTDCLDITTGIINDAFKVLNEKDLVIGPALDGGYYLIGMKNIYDELFMNINWSSKSVFSSTIEKANKLNLNFSLLPTLNDIDTEEDLYSPIGRYAEKQ